MATNSTASALRVILLRQISPPAPPCFESRGAWLEYVTAADQAHKESEMPGRGPTLPGRGAEFNPAFSFCGDCTADYRAEMRGQRRCRPEWVEVQLLGDAPLLTAAGEGACAL